MLFIIVCWTVCHVKKHYKELTKTSVGMESSLPFISRFDLNIVQPPIDIQLCKVLSSLKLRNKLWNEQKQILVLDSYKVEYMVVLNQLEWTILPLDKKDRYYYRQLREVDMTSLGIFWEKDIELCLLYNLDSNVILENTFLQKQIIPKVLKHIRSYTLRQFLRFPQAKSSSRDVIATTSQDNQ